jgi:branched-chain amino acid aminotransferase
MSEIDWKNLVFGYVPTDYNVRCSYSNGKWGELRVHSEATINLHISAAVLHYAQEAFEGLKAFRGKDGKVRIFRIEENAKRMQSSCDGIKMAKLPVEKFEEAVIQAVKLNAKFIPPYESGASLYIRPVLFGTTPLVGVRPAKDYEFVAFVTPVGPYFKGGFQTTPFMLSRKYDRAAPLGTGNIKCGGNYAAGMTASEKAHELGYSSAFYLDSKEKKYIDECSAANFFGIKGNTYVTPNSHSVLPSITNMSLAQIAEQHFHMKVEKRPIPVEELAEFEEAGACGTAAVISPIERIDDIDNNISYVLSKDGKPGEKLTQLYNFLRGIQYGEQPDTFGWNTIVDGI